MDTQKPTLLNQGMKYGLILGFAQVVVYLLLYVIDPSLADFIKEKAIEKMATMMEKFGGSQEEIEKGIESIQKQDFSQSPSKLGSQYLSGVLFGSIPALIIAAILRTKNKPTDDIQ